MVDIASLTYRHPPFGGDMIDTKPMRIMKENILPTSTDQLVQEADQDTNWQESPANKCKMKIFLRFVWAKSWLIKIHHGKTRFKRVWNLLRQILDEGWTGQEHSNAPAPVLDRHRFKMGFHHITDIVSASVDTVDEKWNDLLPMNSFCLHRASANFLLKTCNHKLRWPGQGKIVHKSVWKKCWNG